MHVQKVLMSAQKDRKLAKMNQNEPGLQRVVTSQVVLLKMFFIKEIGNDCLYETDLST